MAFDQIRKMRTRLIGGPAQAPVEYYVSPNGNEKDGKSLNTAFKTITKGVDALNNLDPKIKGAILYIAPGTYIEIAGIELNTDYNNIICINQNPGRTYLLGSGNDGEATPASDDLLKITGRNNKIIGLTTFCYSINYSNIKFFDQSGGGGYGGGNLIENCYFSLFTEDLNKYDIDILGGGRNIIKNCIFEGPSDAAIKIDYGYGAPSDTKIEGNTFLGTNIGINIEGNTFNTIIEKNTFLIGSKTGESMVNAIVITVEFTDGKVYILKNDFEQLAANALLDNKAGGSVFEKFNQYGD